MQWAQNLYLTFPLCPKQSMLNSRELTAIYEICWPYTQTNLNNIIFVRFNQMWNKSTELIQMFNVKSYEKPFISSRIFSRIRTDRQTDRRQTELSTQRHSVTSKLSTQRHSLKSERFRQRHKVTFQNTEIFGKSVLRTSNMVDLVIFFLYDCCEERIICILVLSDFKLCDIRLSSALLLRL
jgi:hypothetical protein